MSAPCGVVVSAEGSLSDRKPSPFRDRHGLPGRREKLTLALSNRHAIKVPSCPRSGLQTGVRHLSYQPRAKGNECEGQVYNWT
jgi:hypothetical protein